MVSINKGAYVRTGTMGTKRAKEPSTALWKVPGGVQPLQYHSNQVYNPKTVLDL